MGNKLKICGPLEQTALELAKQGYNATYIGEQIGVSEGTVVSWSKKNEVPIIKRGNPDKNAREQKFLDLLKKGVFLKKAYTEAGIDFHYAKRLVKEHGLESLTRTLQEAGKDRRLSLEDANERLPSTDHGVVIDFSSEKRQYVIKRADGTLYYRASGHLFRGDPKFGANKRRDDSEVAEYVGKENYRFVPGTFSDTKTPMTAVHNKCGHERSTVIYSFSEDSCPRCNNTGTSGPEIEIAEWVTSLGLKQKKFLFPKECEGKGRGKEIDVFIPELNIGIEHCGLFYHSENWKQYELKAKIEKYSETGEVYLEKPYDSGRNCHKIKMEMSKAKGIELVTIFGNEWINRKEQVKSFLIAKFGRNTRKIGARTTKVKQLDSLEARVFLENYHIQGATRFDVAYGLMLESELVAVVTGSKHHRANNEFVLNRLCFKTNVTVMGGASKLQKQLEAWAKAKGFSAIKTWSDNRWTVGGVYQALGYEITNVLAPDYFYFDNKGNVYTKQSCKKENLIKKGGVGNTEGEMAKSLGLDRIWDCGKKTWVKYL